jgi:hypothetical protein
MGLRHSFNLAHWAARRGFEVLEQSEDVKTSRKRTRGGPVLSRAVPRLPTWVLTRGSCNRQLDTEYVFCAHLLSMGDYGVWRSLPCERRTKADSDDYSAFQRRNLFWKRDHVTLLLSPPLRFTGTSIDHVHTSNTGGTQTSLPERVS